MCICVHILSEAPHVWVKSEANVVLTLIIRLLHIPSPFSESSINNYIGQAPMALYIAITEPNTA